MKNVFALILAGGRVDELSVLTLDRPKSAVPFGGMFRVIDFPLSNLMHSGVEKVGVLCQYRSLALMNHVGIGKWWDFVGRDRGAALLMPSVRHSASNWYKGTADAVYQNLDFVQDQEPHTIMILSGDHVYKMNYSPMFKMHRETDADLTIAFAPVNPEKSGRFGAAELDDEKGDIGGRVLDYKEKRSDAKLNWASLTIYMFKPKVLYKMLTENASNGKSHEFGRDIIPKMLRKYKVYGYKFKGYWGYTRTIDEYWQTNMDILNPDSKINLEEWQVRTNLDHDRLRDRPPAIIGPNAHIENSVIHNGCEIKGSVYNSILFPGVKVENHAKVTNSILFYDSYISEGSLVDNTITDFDVKIGHSSQIGVGEIMNYNQEFPKYLNSGLTLIGKGSELPEEVQIGRNCIVMPGLKKYEFKRKIYESGFTVK